MSMRRFAVSTRLSDSDWRAFNAMAVDRRTTIDAACAWLAPRGYHISRGAVWKYMRALRGGRLNAVPIDRKGAQTFIADVASTLPDSELAALMEFAGYLRGKSGRKP